MKSRNRLAVPKNTHQIRRNSECILNSLSPHTCPVKPVVTKIDPFQNLQRVGNHTPKLKPVCPARRIVKKSSTERKLDINSYQFSSNIIPEPPRIPKPIFYSACSSPRQFIRKSKILKNQAGLVTTTKEQDTYSIRIRKIPSSCVRDATRKIETGARDQLNLDYNTFTLDRIKTPNFHAVLETEFLSYESYSCSSESTCLPSTNHSTPVSSSKANSHQHLTNQPLFEKLKRDFLKGTELYNPAIGEIPQEMSFGDIYPNF